MNDQAIFKYFTQVSLLGLLFLLVACGATDQSIQTPSVVVSPTPAATVDLSSALTAVPLSVETAEIEIAATNTAVPPTNTPLASTVAAQTAVPATATSSPTPINKQANYAVVFVESDDVLNVRSGPGVAFGIVGTLPPTADNIQITGDGQMVSGSTWVPIQRGLLTGWVNGRFLTQDVPETIFCTDLAAAQLLDRLQTAVANQDDALLSQLIHPERGLRVRLLWHEAETRLDNLNLLSDPVTYNWGAAAGSGEPIIGTTAQILLPRLQSDFLDATETACNEILHGGTPGFVVLPEAYAPINYLSFHRPGSEEYGGLDWGSWVVGLELWQGQYYLSTLVHFQWEP